MAAGSFTVARGEFHAYKYMVSSYELRQWIQTVLGKPIAEGDVPHVLRDGVLLCELVNVMAAGTIAKISKGSNNFQAMENVGHFLAFARERFHMRDEELFTQVDLAEHKNLVNVVKSLHAFAKLAATAGLCTGIVSVGGTREFSDEELNVAKFTLAAEEAAAPADDQPDAPLDLSDETHVAQLLLVVLQAQDGSHCTISQLGHYFYERTGVSWKRNLRKKGFGAFPDFLARHTDIFTVAGEEVSAK
eukprot:c32354_g1_i1.p1 GENE.c32354_g1_i1~~c32354_g1_i1.p1  ORF type:complete len:257 (+),score=52.78 c32354_g1_i1:36-773(+)